MSNELSPEEQERIKIQEEESKKKAEEGKVGISDEDFKAEFAKRMQGNPEDFIKKTEVLTQEQKDEIERGKRAEALSYGLQHKIISPEDLENYNKAKSGDKLALAKQKFIALSPDDPDAGEVFDKMLRADEPDEVGEEFEEKKPNKVKKKIAEFAIKLAEEELESGLGKKIGSLPQQYERHLEAQALITSNKALITKAVSEIPNRLEIEVEIGGAPQKVGIEITPAEIAEAEALLLTEAGRKGLEVEGLKMSAGTYLMSKNIKRLVQEASLVAFKNGVASVERGSLGLDADGKIISNVSGKRAALINSGLISK